jgi:hypothetical protein
MKGVDVNDGNTIFSLLINSETDGWLGMEATRSFNEIPFKIHAQ